MNRSLKLILGSMLVCVVLLVQACARSPITSFYTITAAPQVSITESSSYARLSLRVPLPSVPQLVDRTEIVTRISPVEVMIHEEARWAGDLREMIREFLITSMRNTIPNLDVRERDPKGEGQASRILKMSFAQFDIIANERVDIHAEWRLEDDKRTTVAGPHTIVLSETLAGPSIESAVLSLHKALQLIAEAVAESLSPIATSGS